LGACQETTQPDRPPATHYLHLRCLAQVGSLNSLDLRTPFLVTAGAQEPQAQLALCRHLRVSKGPASGPPPRCIMQVPHPCNKRNSTRPTNGPAAPPESWSQTAAHLLYPVGHASTRPPVVTRAAHGASAFRCTFSGRATSNNTPMSPSDAIVTGFASIAPFNRRAPRCYP
jgi:hypothetical protein